MTTEVVFTPSAMKDLARLDRQVYRRVMQALQRLADTGQGNIARLQGTENEFRLRVGDWRVRYLLYFIVRQPEPPATGEEQVRVIEVLRVLPRSRAYR